MSLSDLLGEVRERRGLAALVAEAKERAEPPEWVGMLDQALALVQAGQGLEADRLRQEAARRVEALPSDSPEISKWQFYKRYNDVGEELSLLYAARQVEQAAQSYDTNDRAVIKGITIERVRSGRGLGRGEERLLITLAPKWLGPKRRAAQTRELARGAPQQLDKVANRVLSQIATSGASAVARIYYGKLFAPKIHTDPSKLDPDQRYTVWEAHKASDRWMLDRSYYGVYLRPGSEGVFYLRSPDHVVTDAGFDPNTVSTPSTWEG